jgi:hypothetical protein
MAKTKEAFSWDTEKALGTISEGEKIAHDISICTKGDKTFVVASKRVLKKDGWGIVKNQTFNVDVFKQMCSMVNGHWGA